MYMHTDKKPSAQCGGCLLFKKIKILCTIFTRFPFERETLETKLTCVRTYIRLIRALRVRVFIYLYMYIGHRLTYR